MDGCRAKFEIGIFGETANHARSRARNPVVKGLCDPSASAAKRARWIVTIRDMYVSMRMHRTE